MSATDDTEARFRAIMDAEFGPQPGGPAPSTEPRDLSPTPASEAAAPAPREAARPGTRDDFSMTAAMDAAVPDDPDEPFVPPRPRPAEMPKGSFLASSLLMSFAVLVFLGAIFGAEVGPLVGWAVGAFLIGLVVALVSLPKNREPLENDGAQV